MEHIYYPSEQIVKNAMYMDDPLLMLVSHDETKILLCNIDDVGEHYILLKSLGYKEDEMDNYFRVVVNQDGADWNFVCPSSYKNINDEKKRTENFYRAGIYAINKALAEIGYLCEINIPQRYQRHLRIFNDIKDEFLK